METRASEAARSACPCKRLRCERHGDCEACRRHHDGRRNPVACERENKKRGNSK